MKKQYCSTNGYMKYAGIHLVIELWNGKNFSSLPAVRRILKDAVKACNATLINMDLHKFSPYGGISGVAIIMESHISIHTWPELSYAALDIFVCGNANPYGAIGTIKKGFRPKKMQVAEFKRGIM